jgi:hypothetical protein
LALLFFFSRNTEICRRKFLVSIQLSFSYVLVRDKVKRREAYFFVAMLETEAKQRFYHNFMVKLVGKGVWMRTMKLNVEV